MTNKELLAKARKDYPPGTIFHSNHNPEIQPEISDQHPYIYNFNNCIAVRKSGWHYHQLIKVKNVFKTFI